MKPAPPVTRTTELMGQNLEHLGAETEARVVGRHRQPGGRSVPARMRVLILSADIGEGHDLPARVLRDAIAASDPAAEVSIRDSLEIAGPLVRGMVREGAEVILDRVVWLFDLQYWLIARFPPTRAFAGALGVVLAGRRLRRAVVQARPDVVVSTYPGATHVLGALRRRGWIRVPVV